MGHALRGCSSKAKVKSELSKKKRVFWTTFFFIDIEAGAFALGAGMQDLFIKRN